MVSRQLAFATTIAFVACSAFSFSTPWRVSKLDATDLQAHEHFVYDLTALLKQSGATHVVFSADNVEIPHPNLRLRFAVAGLDPVSTRRISEMAEVVPFAQWGEVFVLVENGPDTYCGYIPDCKASEQIAAEIRDRFAVKTRKKKYQIGIGAYSFFAKP